MTDDEDDRNIHLCVGCRRASPEVNTEYTLISARFGWRLTRVIRRDGSPDLEWRCPDCWNKFKNERSMARTPGDGIPAVRPPPASNKPSTPPPPSSNPLLRRRGR